jgi:hypothetical protein
MLLEERALGFEPAAHLLVLAALAALGEYQRALRPRLSATQSDATLLRKKLVQI